MNTIKNHESYHRYFCKKKSSMQREESDTIRHDSLEKNAEKKTPNNFIHISYKLSKHQPKFFDNLFTIFRKSFRFV